MSMVALLGMVQSSFCSSWSTLPIVCIAQTGNPDGPGLDGSIKESITHVAFKGYIIMYEFPNLWFPKIAHRPVSAGAPDGPVSDR